MCGIFRLTTVYSGMAGRGGIWLMLCVYRYADCMAAEGNGMPLVQDSTVGRKHGIPMQQGVYLCMIYGIQTQYTTAIARASQRPGACIACACACVCALYYYIIILL